MLKPRKFPEDSERFLGAATPSREVIEMLAKARARAEKKAEAREQKRQAINRPPSGVNRPLDVF
jgi:hypothetical protein